jgi:hypothetical protein
MQVSESSTCSGRRVTEAKLGSAQFTCRSPVSCEWDAPGRFHVGKRGRERADTTGDDGVDRELGMTGVQNLQEYLRQCLRRDSAAYEDFVLESIKSLLGIAPRLSTSDSATRVPQKWRRHRPSEQSSLVNSSVLMHDPSRARARARARLAVNAWTKERHPLNRGFPHLFLHPYGEVAFPFE